MNHRQKVKLARRLYNHEMRDKDGKLHRKLGVGIFQTTAWDKRREAIATRVRNREIQAQYAAKARREKEVKQ